MLLETIYKLISYLQYLLSLLNRKKKKKRNSKALKIENYFKKMFSRKIVQKL